jgi:hypothetical protein
MPRVPSPVPESATSQHIVEVVPSTLVELSDAVNGVASNVTQWWFAALDQRCFVAGPERWVAEVVGIHLDGIDVWIQLESAVGSLRSLILHVTQGTGLHEAIDAIETMLTRDSMGLPAPR